MKSLVYKLLFLSVFIMGFTSCDDREDTEFNLPGEWYTSDEIDFGIYTWGRGTVMTFNERYQGTIGSKGDPNYLLFRWSWLEGSYNVMELVRGEKRCVSKFGRSENI